MDDPHALPQQIADALARGWTVLTANQRAARTLRRDFDLRQHALGLTHWQPPAILAWDTWLASLWHRLLLEGHASQLLLNPSQEQTLWRAIIDADAGSPSLRDSLAELAATAWLRLHHYCGRHRLSAAASTADTRAFARWAKVFEARCEISKLLTAAQLPEALIAAFDAGQLAVPPGLLRVGFDAQTPAQTALLNALRAVGTPTEELDPTHPANASPHLLVDALDPHTELDACARWLRDRLAANPHAQLAVIVPNIDEDRAQIDRAFRRILAPELNDITAPAHSGPFEFSLGVPLAHTPLVAAALDILHWATGPLPIDRVSALLLSPHFAASSDSEPAAELLPRAEFDAFTLRNRNLLQPQLSLEELSSIASSSKHAAGLPLLRRHLQTLHLHLRRENLTTRDRSHADWAAAFQDLLDIAGWAPPAHLDSAEFQTRRKWESALDELATLDFDAPANPARIPFQAALSALARIAAETLFAPESRHAPIQIMGPLESAGSSFDAIWFLRAGDLAWPPNVAPHPLLPWLLQRELLMPGADPAHDSDHARRITARIAASAPTVLFSYAQHTMKGRQRPSPVLAALHPSPRACSQVAPAEPAPIPIALDAFTDDAPIPPPPGDTLRGGASILQAQAACGFRAFAERRLFSSAPDAASLGLDARERGSLVHAVLHAFWAETRDQATLRRMTTTARDALLTRSIDEALARDHAHPASGWPQAYLDAERRRLLRLLGHWLDYEATQRPSFTVKSSEEQLEAVSIGPLRLDIRVDRVDEVILAPDPAAPDRTLTADIILDYKTGRAAPADWNGPRPDQPQLPLYAVVSPAPRLAAVAFASIRPGKDMGLAGYQAQNGILPGATKKQTGDLDVQREEWRTVLTQLAEDFHSGRATLADPNHYPRTCQYCQQRLLCRLDRTILDDAALEEADFDSDAPLAGTDPEA